jgi:bifunctional non-homologous end joining protein LigD
MLRRTARPRRAPADDSGAQSKLGTYHAKRDFGRTPEPSGKGTRRRARGSDGELAFVVQKHAATRLHYDFRLELDGVLLSWAIPRGPSLDPSDRRLAVRTEDHPIEYGDFEGVIPHGEYGGGAVIVWDRGTWQPDGDAQEALRRGRLTFALAGEKLSGRFHLIKTRGDGKADSWLFFKGKDDSAAQDAGELTEREPRSVVSGRTIEEVAEASDQVWHSNRAAGGGSKPAPNTIKGRIAAAVAEAAKARAGSSGKAKGSTAKRQARTRDKPTASAAKTSTAAAAPGPDLSALIRAIPKRLPSSVKLTNLDKVLYPEQGLSKAAVVAYYAAVCDRMLPLCGDRPLMLLRCPEGRHKQCFVQKHAGRGTPEVLHRVPITEGGKQNQYLALDNFDGLVALAQMGVLEIHTWGAHRDKVERPDLLVMDLDPDESLPWQAVRDAALDLRRRLADLSLDSFVKTTGGKGLHVVVPLERRIGWDEHKEFAEAVALAMVRDEPHRYVATMTKSKRSGKIFVDYLRNGRGSTAIAAYSTRARPGAPVAAPITWDELEAGVSPSDFTVLTMPERLQRQRRDPWHGFADTRQSITAAMRRELEPRRRR